MSCGSVYGCTAQIARWRDEGNSLEIMVATSLKLTLLAASRWLAPRPPPPVAMVAVALSMPSGLPTPLPWRNAYSSVQTDDTFLTLSIPFTAADLDAA